MINIAMKKVIWTIAGILLLASLAYAQNESKEDVLFQVSTINALLAGVYDGEATFKQLAENGDCGIGTFNHLDGEMVAIDGKFFQVKVDGKVYLVSPDQKTPFACVTFFNSDKIASLGSIDSLESLKMQLNKQLPTKNIIYAIKISGTFEYVKTRSVPEQEKPYLPLAEVVKNQAIFEFENISGTIIGFWCPEYLAGINVSGYHLHFISEDYSCGGHLLDCRMDNLKAEIDETSDFFMALPSDYQFRRLDLTFDKKEELEKVEK